MLIYDGRERIMIFCYYRFAYGILLAIDYGFWDKFKIGMQAWIYDYIIINIEMADDED